MARKDRFDWLMEIDSILGSRGGACDLLDRHFMAAAVLALAVIADALHEMGEPLPRPRGPAFSTDDLEGDE